MRYKILVLFLCAAAGTAVGLIVMRSFKRDLAYMEGVCAMINELKRSIAYRRESAAAILSGFATDSGLLKKHMSEYAAYVASKDGTLKISRGFLSKTAHKRVCELFGAIGSSDGTGQIKELEMHADIFDELKKEAETRSKKYGALAVKLGFLFGVGVGVLFL